MTWWLSIALGLRPTHQVKHTRVGDTLSFADLTGAGDGKSLLRELADGWAAITRAGETCETHLVTNRELATRSSCAPGAAEREELPALAEFWRWMQETVAGAETLDGVNVPEGWHGAWQRWLAALELLSATERVVFLRSLSTGENRQPAT